MVGFDRVTKSDMTEATEHNILVETNVSYDTLCSVASVMPDFATLPWAGKIPWRRKWQPTPVFLPGGFHGQRNLVGYSPRSRT